MIGRMTELAAHLHDLAELLLDVDTGVIDDADLHRLVVAVQRERARLQVAAARLIAEWDERCVWASNGSRNPSQRLARETHTSIAAARREMHVAAAVRRMPVAARAVRDGRLSVEHLEVFSRVATPERSDVFQRDEELLVDQCSRLSFAHGVKVARYWADAADGEMPDPPVVESTMSTVQAATTFGDTVVGQLTLNAIDGAIFTGELDRLVDALRSHPPDELIRTPAQWRALALVEMATRSRTAPAAGRRPAPLFTVHMGEGTFRNMCELANGTVLHPHQLAPHLDTAVYETMLFGADAMLITASPRRGFTGALRRAIQARDRHCTHSSGCDEPADRCDIDHVVPVAQGGPTDQYNGRVECRTHNRRPDRHDHDAVAPCGREPEWLDHVRARLRWRLLLEVSDGDRGP